MPRATAVEFTPPTSGLAWPHSPILDQSQIDHERGNYVINFVSAAYSFTIFSSPHQSNYQQQPQQELEVNFGAWDRFRLWCHAKITFISEPLLNSVAGLGLPWWLLTRPKSPGCNDTSNPGALVENFVGSSWAIAKPRCYLCHSFEFGNFISSFLCLGANDVSAALAANYSGTGTANEDAKVSTLSDITLASTFRLVCQLGLKSASSSSSSSSSSPPQMSVTGETLKVGTQFEYWVVSWMVNWLIGLPKFISLKSRTD